MNRCPKCGSGIEDGKAYCSNPACGAVVDKQAPVGKPQRYVIVDKEINLGFKLDFVLLSRLAAAAIAALAALILYFSRK